ncbi:MAG: preprotein translocase subunit SecE [Amphiplicatus sp.]
MAKGKASGGAIIEGAAEEVKKKKKKTNPVEFVQQAIAEARKVTRTSRNETLISTVMVLIMVAIMSLFFFGVDWLIRLFVTSILSLN